MADYTYPATDWQRRELLLGALGSFWANTYAGNAVVESFIGNRSQLEEQSELDLQLAISTVGRHGMPLYQHYRWRLLTLLRSERNGDKVSLLRYGAGAVYGNDPSTGREYKYGEPFASADFAFPLPTELHDAPLICNRIQSPSLTMIAGLDFVIDQDRKAIVFREDPFANSLVALQDIWQDGVLVDQEAGLWLFMAAIDRQLPYTHFGYLAGLNYPAGEAYRDLLNAVLDASVEGTARRHIEEALSAASGIALTRHDDEVVTDIRTDSRHLLVLTDREAYQFHPASTAIVAVGDVLHAGQPLTDSLQLFEFSNGAIPADLQQWTLGIGFLPTDYASGLTFENQRVPLEVDSDGVFTTVRFALGGWPGDVDRFWEDFHARGVAAGTTLAQLLDVRTSPAGEPTAASLPTTINPLQFLIEQVLRYNAALVRIRVDLLPDSRVGLDALRILRALLPPHTTLLLELRLAAPSDTVAMETAGDTLQPGYEENPQSLSVNSATGDTMLLALIAEDPVLRHVDGFCV